MRWSFPAVLDDAQRASLGCSVAFSGARLGSSVGPGEGTGEPKYPSTRSPALMPLIIAPVHVNHSHGGDILDGTHRPGRLSLCDTAVPPPSCHRPPPSHSNPFLARDTRIAQQKGPASVRRYTTSSTQIARLSSVLTTETEAALCTVILKPQSRPHPINLIRRSSQSILRDLATATPLFRALSNTLLPGTVHSTKVFLHQYPARPHPAMLTVPPSSIPYRNPNLPTPPSPPQRPSITLHAHRRSSPTADGAHRTPQRNARAQPVSQPGSYTPQYGTQLRQESLSVTVDRVSPQRASPRRLAPRRPPPAHCRITLPPAPSHTVRPAGAHTTARVPAARPERLLLAAAGALLAAVVMFPVASVAHRRLDGDVLSFDSTLRRGGLAGECRLGAFWSRDGWFGGKLRFDAPMKYRPRPRPPNPRQRHASPARRAHCTTARQDRRCTSSAHPAAAGAARPALIAPPITTLIERSPSEPEVPERWPPSRG
ncbi:hypothetical protein V500_06341 [Pseudogymnoascus sp. VKM F-4518 (FW-2643)]|nr:hypothetical protein V500_06341 [Pseudogymnoascus sp. VKM F-4518 (FW-2643)]